MAGPRREGETGVLIKFKIAVAAGVVGGSGRGGDFRVPSGAFRNGIEKT
jgi:hypothetical protein